jgi:transposase-like protein
MTPPIHTERDKRHRFPGAIISHGAWRYDGVHLSDRDAQALLCERGIDVTYEAIHPWCQPVRARRCPSAASPATPPRGHMIDGMWMKRV